MIKLFDCLTAKRRYFIVEEDNMMEVLNMIQSALSISKYGDRISVCGNGCVDGTNSWSIDVNLTTKQWQALLEDCMTKNYKLIIKDVSDKMYFTKCKES